MRTSAQRPIQMAISINPSMTLAQVYSLFRFCFTGFPILSIHVVPRMFLLRLLSAVVVFPIDSARKASDARPLDIPARSSPQEMTACRLCRQAVFVSCRLRMDVCQSPSFQRRLDEYACPHDHQHKARDYGDQRYVGEYSGYSVGINFAFHGSTSVIQS